MSSRLGISDRLLPRSCAPSSFPVCRYGAIIVDLHVDELWSLTFYQYQSTCH